VGKEYGEDGGETGRLGIHFHEVNGEGKKMGDLDSPFLFFIIMELGCTQAQ
jgi:hypothetical protein